MPTSSLQTDAQTDDLYIGVLLGVLGGAAAPCTPKLLEKSEIFRLSEILGCRSEIFITYLYKNALLIIAKMF